jgi:WD40 repeat protein
MLLTRDSHYLFFASGDGDYPDKVSKFSVNKKEVVAKFKGPAFEEGITSMALSPDSNSLYVATLDELNQFSLKDGKVIQSRDINERPDMKGASIHAMGVTRNNQYLFTSTMYVGMPEKGTKEDLSGQELVRSGGPVCVWSTKDLTLVKTYDVDTDKLYIKRMIS